MIGEKLDANISGENAKNAANANGAGKNGAGMSARNGTVGVIGMTGDSQFSRGTAKHGWIGRSLVILAGIAG
jgi:hypothetical protein